ncbi:site-specific integrase [Acinetobacter sp. ANC 4177]|uniref:tyrosine-type recombinase/integrase n=1 Tax=Acinetobacter sp. ANC 4177 TaxID=2529838 RepID=UPI0010400EB1|nr:site-specific integrase [Acinetobacter sp. ANC 4177]TCB75656.1 site-specific integrase [Acinetobacter sp. ANC 4177]
MKTEEISLDIFLKNCEYEIQNPDDIKITSKQSPATEDYSDFPQLINLNNIETSIEFNLFLIEKFRFNDFSTNKAKRGREITKLRIKSLITSLRLFLNWLTVNKVDWKDETYIDDEDPVNLFKNYLIDRIKSEQNHISYESAKAYLLDVKMLYEWATHNHIINRLPFFYSIHSYTNKNTNLITSKKIPNTQIVSSSIKIPKKYKDIKVKVLSAYSSEEYEELINSDYCQTPSRQLWIRLAKEYGLRRIEIAGINDDICDCKDGLYIVTGKNAKKREIHFKEEILKDLNLYRNRKSRKNALHKYYLEHGYNNKSPLFLNTQGNRISEKTISNIIYPVKDEFKAKGIIFDKTFHDLRATYAVERVMSLLKQGIKMEHIEYVVTDELGHNLFETTKRYLQIRSARISWINQSGVGEFLKEIELADDNQSEDILDDFL